MIPSTSSETLVPAEEKQLQSLMLSPACSSLTDVQVMWVTWSAVCFLCYRDLDARAKNERYRSMFRLTQDERLDGHTGCTLWTPFAKMHVIGQLFISNNYICFNSREEDVCQLIIPLREVNTVQWPVTPEQEDLRSSKMYSAGVHCGEGRQQQCLALPCFHQH